MGLFTCENSGSDTIIIYALFEFIALITLKNKRGSTLVSARQWTMISLPKSDDEASHFRDIKMQKSGRLGGSDG